MRSKIAKIGKKQRPAAKIFTSHRKSMSLNPFSVRDLRPEVELMYVRIHTCNRHKITQTGIVRPK